MRTPVVMPRSYITWSAKQAYSLASYDSCATEPAAIFDFENWESLGRVQWNGQGFPPPPPPPRHISLVPILSADTSKMAAIENASTTVQVVLCSYTKWYVNVSLSHRSSLSLSLWSSISFITTVIFFVTVPYLRERMERSLSESMTLARRYLPFATFAKEKALHPKQSAVALAFEEMRTPYASGREINSVQKFGNGYQHNRETNGAFQKHLYHRQTMLFANDARFPFTILVCLPWSSASCVVWDVLRLNPAFCVRCTHRFHDFAYS